MSIPLAGSEGLMFSAFHMRVMRSGVIVTCIGDAMMAPLSPPIPLRNMAIENIEALLFFSIGWVLIARSARVSFLAIC